MATTTATRHLAAILAADVVGYSRLMGEDEEGTLARLKAHRRELVDPKIKEHHGRVVKTTGDGLLAEFVSVVDAVRCAAEMQRGMIDREPDLPDERRILFRVGINLGDVIADGDDIFGDGVNVAARLEALAEPGGICVSGTVRDQIRDRLPYPVEDRGEQSVKNIARPLRVYALRPEAIADLPTSSLPGVPPRGRRTMPIAIGAAIGGVLIAVAVGWWLWPAIKPASTPAVSAATTIAQSLTAPRLSIVVLPFANLNNDPDQQYFADGITENATTDLSRIPQSFVISRNTAFTYRNKPIDTKQIGRDLGVRYVLEGSVQRSANRVRVNAQLIDAQTDTHLWAERFDGDTSDLLSLQDEITGRIATALNVELARAEAARPTQNPDAVDYIFRGRAVIRGGPPSRERYVEALALYEHALALDPQSVDAKIGLAYWLAARVIDNMTDTAAADLVRAEGLAGQALAAAPRNGYAHNVKGQVLRAQHRYAEAIPEYEAAALSSDFNPLYAFHSLAHCKVFTGSIEEAIPLEEQMIRLSPRDPFVGVYYRQLGLAHLLQSRPNEAVGWLEKARNAAPAHPNIRAQLAYAYALAGEPERAATELAEARRLSTDDRFSSLARLREVEDFGQLIPKVRALFEATYIAGLHKAGMPEE
jgi:TolB-like protein/class 3 adenylate cyclase/Tfp pilus assembly protein PilF